MSNLIASAKRILREVDYLQRRSVELRTGVPMGGQRRQPR